MKVLFIVILLGSGLISHPVGADTYSEALTFLKTDQLNKALISIETSLQESKSAAAYELKGRILSELDKPEEALESMNQALQLEPERSSTYYHIGQIYFKDQQWADAYGAYRYAIELDPDYKNPILKMIYCLVVMENYPVAHQWLTTLDPTNDLKPDYYFARAATAYATGTAEEYISVLRQARTIYSTQVFNLYEPDLLRVIQTLKKRKNSSIPATDPAES